MGANFESKLIRKLCDITDIKNTRTTPYHPMGNGMVERFNKTLLNMMATLPEVKKTDWKAHVSTLTHAYNAAVHDSTGFGPYYLMFGRHPRLAIDAFLGHPSNNLIAESKQDYSYKLKEQLHTAYDKASKETKHAGAKYKKYYDKKIRYAVLQPGDRVRIQNVGLQGRQKLADKWQKQPYIVTSQPIPDIPVYEIQRENGHSKPKLLHRNMLLPFVGLPCPTDDEEPEKPPRDRRKVAKELEREVKSTESDSSDDSSSVSTEPDYGVQLRPLSISCQKERAKTDRIEFLRTKLQDKGEVPDRDVLLTDFRLDKMTSDVGSMFLQSTLKMFSISDIYIFSCPELRHLQVIESGYVNQ